jgi:hypothetical protein
LSASQAQRVNRRLCSKTRLTVEFPPEARRRPIRSSPNPRRLSHRLARFLSELSNRMRCVRRCLRGSQARVWREAVRHWGTETGIVSRRIGVFTTVDRDRESLVEGSSGQTSNTDGCRKYEQVARRKCGKVQSAGRATRSKQRWCGVLTTLRLALGGEAKPWLLVPVHFPIQVHSCPA